MSVLTSNPALTAGVPEWVAHQSFAEKRSAIAIFVNQMKLT